MYKWIKVDSLIILGMFGRPRFTQWQRALTKWDLTKWDSVLWPKRIVQVCLRAVQIASTLYLVDFSFVTCSTWHAEIDAMYMFWKHFVPQKSTHAPSCSTRWFLVLPWIDRDRRHDRKLRNRFSNCHIIYLNFAIGTSWFIPNCTSWFLQMSMKKHAAGASVALRDLQSRSTHWGRANRPLICRRRYS